MCCGCAVGVLWVCCGCVGECAVLCCGCAVGMLWVCCGCADRHLRPGAVANACCIHASRHDEVVEAFRAAPKSFFVVTVDAYDFDAAHGTASTHRPSETSPQKDDVRHSVTDFIIIDRFWTTPPHVAALYLPPHMPCDMLYLVPMHADRVLVGACMTGACNLMQSDEACPIH